MIKRSILNVSWNREFIKEIFTYPNAPKNLLKCNQCGTCTANCPAARFTSYNPAQLVRDVIVGAREKILKSLDIWQCFYCYTCHANCPRGNSPTELIRILRQIAIEEGYAKEEIVNLSVFGECFIEFGIGGISADIIEKHTYDFGKEWTNMRLAIDNIRENLGLEPIGLSADAQKQLKTVLQYTGFIERTERIKQLSAISD